MPEVSDHFDGRRFHNPEPISPRGLGTILRWQLTKQAELWPRWVDDPPWPPPGPVTPGHASLTFIGHSTFLIRLMAQDGTPVTVLTDPVFSARCSPLRWAGPKRARAPGLALDALPRPDAVLVSHNHYDHLDLASLRALNKLFAPRFVTTPGNARTLRRAGITDAAELDWWETLQVGSLQATATPARHFARRGMLDTDRSLWAGFMLELDGQRLLFAGDSGAGRHWAGIRERLGPPAVALLPIGAYLPRHIMQDVHMDPHEAVQASLDLGAARAIGMHFGTFQLTDEGIDAPLRALEEARAEAGLSREAFDVLAFGETRELPLA